MPTHNVTSLAKLNEIIRAEDDRLVVIDFYTTWCPPCKAIAPLYSSLSDNFVDQAVFLKVNCDDAEDIARAHDISAMPTFQFFHARRLVESFSGADAPRLRTAVANLLREIEANIAPRDEQGGGEYRPHHENPQRQQPHPPSRQPHEQYHPRHPHHSDEEGSPHHRGAPAIRVRNDRRPNPRTADSRRSNGPRPGDARAHMDGRQRGPTPRGDGTPRPDPAMLRAMVRELGYSVERASKALVVTGNRSLDEAVEWCFNQDEMRR